MKDVVNLFYRYSSFACSIDNINKNNKSRKNQSGMVTSFTLRCACGRDYKKTSTGERPQSSSKMTACEWKAWYKKGMDKDTAKYGWSFTIEVPHHNHNRALGIGAYP